MKKWLKKKSGFVLTLVAVIISGIVGIQAKAEEKGIDATLTTTYSYTLSADKTGIIIEPIH